MAKVVLFAVVGLGVLIPSAHAVDWKINATQTETLEVNNNRLLAPVPKGESYNTINSILFNALALTPSSTFAFEGGLDYRTFAGPGEVGNLNSFNNNVKASYEKSTKLTTYNVYASRSERDTATLQLLETGQATVNGTTTIVTAGGGFRHALTPRDLLSWQTVYTETDTSRSSTAPTPAAAGAASKFTSVLNAVDLKHAVNQVTDWLPSLQYQQLNFGGPAPVTIQFWRATMGVQSQFTRSLSVKASAGGTALNGGQQTAITAVPGAFTVASSSGSAFDWVADIALTYKYTFGTVSVTAAQTSGPTTFGQFVKSQTLGASASYTINQASSVTTGVSFSHLISGQTTSSDLITASTTYSYTVMRDLHAQLTYRHTQRTNTSTTPVAPIPGTTDPNKAQSDAMLVVLRRDFTILP